MSTSSTDGATGARTAGLLEVGRVVRPHGLSGEVVVDLISNRPERLERGSVLSLGTGESLTVSAARPFQHRFLVVFEGVTTREQADSLRAAVLLAAPIEDPDALFVHDLIGCEVVEASGTSRGRVAAVQENPASDLLVGEDGWLVPLRFVVARETGRLVVEVPPGLFE